MISEASEARARLFEQLAGAWQDVVTHEDDTAREYRGPGRQRHDEAAIRFEWIPTGDAARDRHGKLLEAACEFLAREASHGFSGLVDGALVKLALETLESGVLHRINQAARLAVAREEGR